MSTILLVDAQASRRKLAAMTLQQAGHRVVQGSRLRDAPELALRHAPELVLMGLEHPLADSLWALRCIKAHPATFELRLHALGARVRAVDEVCIRAAGFDGLMATPLDYRALQRYVDAALRTRHAARH